MALTETSQNNRNNVYGVGGSLAINSFSDYQTLLPFNQLQELFIARSQQTGTTLGCYLQGHLVRAGDLATNGSKLC